ncbi:nickel insertion protein [Gracilibacillus sp. S3-1-1]|uniref:Nickel insertion protein n=1 Tax=Gracilibacillus pellucidus TaxID=3095368 RepID=A0ACC6M2H7_9BACI|nr:nickel insertion protein [Gracilibacillus sp. S3-1-1]MDX8045159.1 nickel insertion protein [Gracilibacillus sp. S3-1-1]
MGKHPPDHEHVDDNMIKVEVNLDDTPGEWLGYVMDKLLDAGANDVYYTPIYMKKNRPAVQLQLLCSEAKLADMKQILLAETTTLGIRYYPLSVFRMERRIRTVDTKWGPVRVKEGIQQGEVIKASPEYDDCKQIAEQNGIALKDVYHAVWTDM